MHSVYATPDRDFLATPDEWFRPVDLADGPDGALYVVDMYRAVIEHPEWVPEELKRRPDLRHGDDRGRIYRVRPAGQGPRQPAATALAGAAHDELLAALEDANGWRRDTAARLIFERQARSLAPPLEEMALKSKHAAARARALWLLEGLAALSDAVLIEALADKVGGVQEQALILCEARLTNSADLERAILEFQPAQEFDAPRVLFQHVLTLAHAKDSSAKFNLLANYALQFAADSWMRRAAFIAAGKAPRRLLEAILSREAPASSPGPAAARDYSGHQLLLVEAASLIGARQVPEEIEALLAMLVSLWELRAGNDREALERMVLAGLAGLGDGLVRRGGSLGATVAKLESARAGVEQALRPIYMEAARIAQDPTGKLPRRGAALALLRHAPFSLAGQALLALASDPADQALRLEAISALAGHDDRAADLALLEQFVAGTPAVRRAAQQALLRAAPRINLLFDAISTGGVSAARIDPAAAQALRAHADAGIRGRANELFAALTPENRKGVLEAYQPALALEADAHKGREVFEKHCAGCHRVAGLGVDVAPDIADSRTKTPAQLLVDILNPNQAIDGNYVSYTALLASGQTESGVITAETSTSVTLRQAEGKTLVLLRADLQELRSTGVSLMPEGFEKQITLQQMADLLLFLKNWRYLDGQTPLGK
jgi:putative heme-binding domain-containing protein